MPMNDVKVKQLDYTTANLGSAANYTGTAKGATEYNEVCAIAYAVGIGGTVYIDQSHDGTNWDFSTNAAVTAGTGKELVAKVYAQYVRLRYVNGAGTTTTFRCGLYGRRGA